MVRLAQTVQLFCIDANTVSKRTKTRYHMTHVTWGTHTFILFPCIERVNEKLRLLLVLIEKKPVENEILVQDIAMLMLLPCLFPSRCS
jgi:hypothetical protein